MGDCFGSDLYTHHGKKNSVAHMSKCALGCNIFARVKREKESVSKVYSWPRGAQQRLAHVCANGW